jgi:hypothetical protein
VPNRRRRALQNRNEPNNMANPSIRIIVNGTLLVVFAAVTVIVFWPFHRAATEMETFCAGFTTGMSVAQVKALAAARGYEVAIDPSGKLRVSDLRLNTNHSCELAVDSASKS